MVIVLKDEEGNISRRKIIQIKTIRKQVERLDEMNYYEITHFYDEVNFFREYTKKITNKRKAQKLLVQMYNLIKEKFPEDFEKDPYFHNDLKREMGIEKKKYTKVTRKELCEKERLRGKNLRK